MGRGTKLALLCGTFTLSSMPAKPPNTPGSWRKTGCVLAAVSQHSDPISSVRKKGAGRTSNSVSHPLGNVQFRALGQMVWSLVTISTRTVWSKELQMQSPLLSGLQSKLETGCVDKVTFCRRLTEPATPISTPSESFFDR